MTLALPAVAAEPLSLAMVGFFEVLPVELGSVGRDTAILVLATGLGLGVARLVGLGPDLPPPLIDDGPMGPRSLAPVCPRRCTRVATGVRPGARTRIPDELNPPLP